MTRGRRVRTSELVYQPASYHAPASYTGTLIIAVPDLALQVPAERKFDLRVTPEYQEGWGFLQVTNERRVGARW